MSRLQVKFYKTSRLLYFLLVALSAGCDKPRPADTSEAPVESDSAANRLVTEAGMQVASDRQGFVLIGKLKLPFKPEWSTAKQVIFPASDWKGEINTDPPVSILQQRAQSSEHPSSETEYVKPVAGGVDSEVSFDQYILFPTGKTKERFVGQHVIEPTKGEPIYLRPFLFTVDHSGKLDLQLEPHPYVRLLASGALQDTPANAASSPVVLATEGAVTNLAPTADGTRLVITQNAEPYIRFLDLEKKQWVQPIPIPTNEPVLATVSGEILYALKPATGVLERWNLRDGRREKEIVSNSLRDAQQIAAPVEANGWLAVATDESLQFLDSTTLEPATNVIPRLDGAIEKATAMSLSASVDGNLYGYLLQTAKEVKGATFFPSPDGPWLRKGNGPPRSGLVVDHGGGTHSGSIVWNLPDPLSSCWVRWQGGKVSGRDAVPPPPYGLEIYSESSKAKRVLARFETFEELNDVLSAPQPMLPPLAKRVVLLMKQRKLITVGRGGKTLYVRDLNFASSLAADGPILISRWPGVARRGTELRHQFVCLANSPVRFQLNESPPGAELSESGELRWRITDDFAANTARFSVSVDNNGTTTRYEFTTRLLGPLPLFVSAIKGNAWSKSIAVPGKEVAVPGKAVTSCLAGGGKYLICQRTAPDQLIVIDLDTAEICGQLPMDEIMIGFTANANQVFVCNNELRNIEVRSLPDLSLIRSHPLDGKCGILAAGYGSSASLFAAIAPTANQASPPDFYLLDPHSMERTPVQVPAEIRAKGYFNDNLRFYAFEGNKEGTVFTLRTPHGLIEGIFQIAGTTARFEDPPLLKSPQKELMSRFEKSSRFDAKDKIMQFRFHLWITSSLGLTSNLFARASEYGKLIVFPPDRTDVALSVEPIPSNSPENLPRIDDDIQKLVLFIPGRLLIYPWKPREWFQKLQ